MHYVHNVIHGDRMSSLREDVHDLVKKDPSMKNGQLYLLFPDASKSSVRVYANEIRNIYIANNPNVSGVISPTKRGKKGVKRRKRVVKSKKHKSLTEPYLEQLILDRLSTDNSSAMVRTAVEFYLKIKTDKFAMKDDFDMDKFLIIGTKKKVKK